MTSQTSASADENQSSTEKPHVPIATVISDVGALARSFSALALREAEEAFHALPQLIKSAFFFVLVGFVFWISLCVSLGLIAFWLSASPIVGVAGFLIPQLILMIWLHLQIKSSKQKLSLPNTRKAVSHLLDQEKSSNEQQ